MVFSCGKHKFECETKEDFNKHREAEIHDIQCKNCPCRICGVIVPWKVYTGKWNGKSAPVICDSCTAQIKGDVK